MATHEEKLDKIQEDIGEIKTHLAVYNEQLKVHIKATRMLEEQMKPVQKHVQIMNLIWKILWIVSGMIVSIVGIVAAIKLIVS